VAAVLGKATLGTSRPSSGPFHQPRLGVKEEPATLLAADRGWALRGPKNDPSASTSTATPPPRSKGSGVPRAAEGIEGRSQIPLEISDAVVGALTGDALDARTAQEKIGPELLPARVLNKGLCPCSAMLLLTMFHLVDSRPYHRS